MNRSIDRSIDRAYSGVERESLKSFHFELVVLFARVARTIFSRFKVRKNDSIFASKWILLKSILASKWIRLSANTNSWIPSRWKIKREWSIGFRYQQSDLDLVRCRHGNFDSVKRNRSADTVLVDSGRKYGRNVALEDRCHRNSDLDLVGTLPKRKQDARNSSGRSFESNSSSQPCIVNATDNDDLLMKIVHKPDCELLKHRQQFGKCVDLKLSKLTSGEPQDQGYASERSPEDEHPPSLPGQPFPSVTPGK